MLFLIILLLAGFVALDEWRRDRRVDRIRRPGSSGRRRRSAAY